MKRSNILLIALVLALGFSSSAYAGEGSHMEDGSMKAGKGEVAIDGYCPVCITMGKYVKGDPQFSTEYKGKVYYFPGFDQQKMFINDPETYIAKLEMKYQDLKKQTEGSGMIKDSYKGSGMMKDSNMKEGSY